MIVENRFPRLPKESVAEIENFAIVLCPYRFVTSF